MADYFIDPVNGDIGNSGLTKLLPKKSFDLLGMNPGNNFYLKRGTTLILNGAAAYVGIIAVGGGNGNHIISSYSTDAANALEAKPRISRTDNNIFFSMDSAGNTVSDITFDGTAVSILTIGINTGGQQNTFRGLDFENHPNSGTEAYAIYFRNNLASYVGPTLIEDCTFTGGGRGIAQLAATANRVYANIRIQSCTFTNLTSHPILFTTDANYDSIRYSNITIDDCTITDCAGALWIRASNPD